MYDNLIVIFEFYFGGFIDLMGVFFYYKWMIMEVMGCLFKGCGFVVEFECKV